MLAKNAKFPGHEDKRGLLPFILFECPRPRSREEADQPHGGSKKPLQALEYEGHVNITLFPEQIYVTN